MKSTSVRAGVSETVMRSPDGELMPSDGCYLSVVEEERLVWTDALLPGFRPSMTPFFTGMLDLEDHPEGTRYIARAIHGDPEKAAQHREMGFEQGWGSALDQLVDYAAETWSG